MSKRKRVAVLFVFHEVHQHVCDFISNATFSDDIMYYRYRNVL
jgi:hypothetical protein